MYLNVFVPCHFIEMYIYLKKNLYQTCFFFLSFYNYYIELINAVKNLEKGASIDLTLLVIMLFVYLNDLLNIAN